MSIIVLDRDGVINQDSPNYIKSAEEWLPLPGSIEAIAMLCRKGYRIYIATNQAGLARGLFAPTALEAMHQKLKRLVGAQGGAIAGVYFCPHHPDDQCACRKPLPGLLEQIQASAGTSIKGMPFVGDSLKDLQAALAIGAKPVLVRTGNGLKTEARLGELDAKVEVFDDLMQFASQQTAI
jgi:D-glycero-D-manno-heptose 1,7-bisphosphate phosphatase